VFEDSDDLSEEWLGEWLQQRGRIICDGTSDFLGCRDDMVIATKYTGNYKSGAPDKHPISINR
jgi:aryl-alcohol dehydrogenase-like predicted oxidoreductase